MICPYCGAAAKDGSRFCESCGAQLGAQQAPSQDAFYGYAPGGLRLAPGYSRKLDSDAVLQALKKQKRAVRITSTILIVLPFLGFVIYGAISDSMEISRAIMYGLVISLIFALTTLTVSLKHRLARPFEGTVTDKKHVHHISDSESRGGRSRNQYFLYITDENGKRRKKPTTLTFYRYLNVGDRVRFLPQFPQPFEKYDKSRDAEIPCLFCGRMNPVENDDCSACRNPLIK